MFWIGLCRFSIGFGELIMTLHQNLTPHCTMVQRSAVRSHPGGAMVHGPWYIRASGGTPPLHEIGRPWQNANVVNLASASLCSAYVTQRLYHLRLKQKHGNSIGEA